MMCGLTADNNLWMGLRFIKQCLLLIYNNTHSTAFISMRQHFFVKVLGETSFMWYSLYILLAAIWQILASSDEYYYRVMQHGWGIMTLTADFIFSGGLFCWL